MRRIGKVFLWLIGVLLVIEVIGIAVTYYSRRIPPHTVLTVRVEGQIEEQPPQDALADLLLGPRRTVTDLVEGLDRAERDPRITGIEVRVGESTLGMAKIQEVRQKIREFNRTGKFSVAYLEFATNRSYYLASACQTVILLPTSLLQVRGLMTSTTFYRGTLDKLGINPDLYHIGEYKNATNVYTEKKYTPAHREASQALLEDFYHQFLGGIAEGRGMKPEDAEMAIRKGPYTAQEALSARLVDRVAYTDQARDLVTRKNGGSKERLSLDEYLRRTDSGGRFKLAVIYATGTILPGRSSDSPFGGAVMGSETIAEQFRRARKDSSIKAVILRVDSPGGAAFASEVIRREVLLTKREKPVVVSMSDVAASGGYWIAMSANRIVAEPGTITGSIGVLTGKLNVMGLFQKLGLSKDYLATTENATIDWPFQDFSSAQRESVQRIMRDIYANFLEGVAEGRHMKVEAVDKIAQGRVWTGERARQLGLVDELGGLAAAITVAKKLAQIPPQERVSLVYLPPPKPLFEKIRDLLGGMSVSAGAAAPRRWVEALESLARVPAWTLLPAVPEAE
jgi:protease-4